MEPTRRWWSHWFIAGVLSGGAIVFNRHVLLFGATSVVAYLLADQYDFLRIITTVSETVSVTQTVTPSRINGVESAQLRMTVARDQHSGGQLTATLSVPTTIETEDDARTTVTVPPGDLTGETTVEVTPSVAGSHEFAQPTLTVSTARGGFTQSFQRGPSRTLVAEPRTPETIHIGRGGQEVRTTLGQHTSGQLESGIDFDELRRYRPGDTARRIDWKATARHTEPYVKKVSPNTSRTLALVFDHRLSMEMEAAAKTKLADAREVALAVLENAERATDMTGFYAVGDAGITRLVQPGATAEQYQRIRTHLHQIEADEHEESTVMPGRSPREAHRAAETLATDTSRFGERLTPYFERTETYVQRVAGDPLFNVVDVHLTDIDRPTSTVIFTDETNQTELIEAVKLASRGTDRVLVLLTPSVLYEPGWLTDLDATVSRYNEFELFRRNLDQRPGVTALEVGPKDHLTTVLDARASTS